MKDETGSADVALKRALLAWYGATHGRATRELPWRGTSEPYAIWVSETMLQQTRAATVVPYWERFLRELPTVQALAEAPEERVLALWSGLGYYRRARMLHAASRRVVSTYGGRVPSELDALRALEGVGPYTAGAIASIAFGERAAAVDGNVARVLARVFAIEDDVSGGEGNARVWTIARRLAAIEEGEPGDWNQALMELGAMVCSPRTPRCEACPLASMCEGLARGIAPDLPRKKGKASPREVRSVAIVLASTRAVVLARRAGRGLMGGLWEAPQVAWGGKTPRVAIRRLALGLGVDPGDLSLAGEVVHELSHRTMRVRVMRGPLLQGASFSLPGLEYDAIERVPLGELRLHTRPHATLTRKVLNMAKEPHKSLR